MKPVLALCALFALAEGGNQVGRILGGEDAKPGQFPFIVGLLRGSGDHFCGATIIGRRVLLTAAHCMVGEDADNIAVRIGTNKRDDDIGKIYKVESFTNHENFNQENLVNDVAVIILSTDIEFGDLVQPVALASQPAKEGDRLTIAGWGLRSYPSYDVPNDLQWMQTNVLSLEKCITAYGEKETEGKFCTLESKGHGICEGDSGGPVTNDQNEVVGIVCQAVLCAKGIPDYMSDVHYHKAWIETHAKCYM